MSQASRPAGMLPVKFNVPLRGDIHRFSKLLVMDEAPKLSFSYRKVSKAWTWISRVLSHLPWGLIILCLCLLFAAAVIFLALKKYGGGKSSRPSAPSAPSAPTPPPLPAPPPG